VNHAEFTFVNHSGRSLVHLRKPCWFTFVNVPHVFRPAPAAPRPFGYDPVGTKRLLISVNQSASARHSQPAGQRHFARACWDGKCWEWPA
jgi:hypothetical protein